MTSQAPTTPSALYFFLNTVAREVADWATFEQASPSQALAFFDDVDAFGAFAFSCGVPKF
jgi:hypothetical protein